MYVAKGLSLTTAQFRLLAFLYFCRLNQHILKCIFRLIIQYCTIIFGQA